MKKTAFKILYVLCLSVLLVSGYHLLLMFLEYHAGTSLYAQTARDYVRETGQEAADTAADYEEDLCPVEVNFKALKAANPDVVGWICSPDTPINYPVLKGQTNDTYLHTMLNGEHNSAGSIFMDSRCSASDTDLVTILYGHHMKNGSMFASLAKYRDQDYYNAHPVLWYLTEEGTFRLYVLAGYVENAGADVYGLFQEPDQLRAYLDQALSRSDFRTAYSADSADRIFLLSTCSYEYEDARYVLVCRPVPMQD